MNGDRFDICKTPLGKWALWYPDGFSEIVMGVFCTTFAEAVAAFVEAARSRCPMCLRGAVIDTFYGWKCEACGSYDFAVGGESP
jgi:hypothetical protein